MASNFSRLFVLSILLLYLSFLTVASSAPRARQNSPTSDLVAHEWGTFTSIAGRNGQSLTWHPSSGPVELPSFVEYFDLGAKVRLSGTVRMETPVLYFYSPRETSVSVRVGFSRGIITEWYPHASRVEPKSKAPMLETALYDHPVNASIAWDSVAVEPGLNSDFPHDGRGSQYYAARETSSAPLVVATGKKPQTEKFLFYRGVAAFRVPIEAQITPDNQILLKNLGVDEVPATILFERRGDRVGYRLGGSLQKEAEFIPPELTATVEELSRELEGILTAQGLYPDEAHAMVKTWHDSWFEEGSRVLYIVPRHFVDSVLPLSINPGPSQVVRVFVGRMELITPSTKQDVETALATHNRLSMMKYARFMEPILDQLKAESPARANELEDQFEATRNNFTAER